MFEKFKRTSIETRLLEEKLYEQVVEELVRGQRRNGLWAKALVDSGGREEKTKALYIQYRVQSLKDELELSYKYTNIVTNSQIQDTKSTALMIDILVWSIGGGVLLAYILLS